MSDPAGSDRHWPHDLRRQDVEPITRRTRDSEVREIARELDSGEFYGLANDRIEWLLKERATLVRECQELRVALDKTPHVPEDYSTKENLDWRGAG